MTFEFSSSLFPHNDWANDQIARAATGLRDDQLDEAFEMGLGTLRRTFGHIRDAECVWVQRWQAKVEVPWPAEVAREPMAVIAEALRRNARERDAFLANVQPPDLKRIVKYRDSKGSLFSATLGDMILQSYIHSTHHRAQAVNMIRRLGAAPPELDYMYWVRRPVEELRV